MLKDSVTPGIVVQHMLQKEWLMVLTVDNLPGSARSAKCRTKQLDVKEFYFFELENIPANNRQPRK